jgi:hypothetical protein
LIPGNARKYLKIPENRWLMSANALTYFKIREIRWLMLVPASKYLKNPKIRWLIPINTNAKYFKIHQIAKDTVDTS